MQFCCIEIILPNKMLPQKLQKILICALNLLQVNEFMIIGLGMGILSMAFLAAILICHRKRKRKNHAEHPMLPSHAHFHTCESIGKSKF